MDPQALGDRGFIAAPLIGTLIFLAAVLFVVHLNQVEKAEVASIVSNSYHSSITSSLEQYRSDMGTLFAVSLSRAIEKFLAKGAPSGTKCNAPWQLFKIANDHDTPSSPGSATRGFTPPGLDFSSPPISSGFYPASALKRNDIGFDYDKFPFCHVNPPNGVDSGNLNKPLCAGNGNGELDYRELRYAKCVGVSNTIRAGICAYNPEYGITAWIDKAGDSVNVGSFTYEVPDASRALSKEFVYTYTCQWPGGEEASDGKMFVVDASVANAPICIPNQDCRDDSNKPCPRGNGRAKLNTDRAKYCNALVGDSLFDCRNFAENLGKPLRCCEQFYKNPSRPDDYDNGKCCGDSTITAPLSGNCPLDPNSVPVNKPVSKIISGCDGGSFLVAVNVLGDPANPDADLKNDVYKRLPRVRVKDKAGNEIQGGAMGESNFKIQVKYPFYKYLDAAFRFYAPFAYGTSGNTADFYNPESNLAGTRNLQGVIAGLCYGNTCNGRSSGQIVGGPYGDRLTFNRDNLPISISSPPNPDSARVAAAKKFVDNFFPPSGPNSVCRMFQPPMCNPSSGAGAGMNVCGIKVIPTGGGFISQNEVETDATLGAIKDYGLCSSDPTKSQAIKIALTNYFSTSANARKIFSGSALYKAGGVTEAPGTYAYADQLSINLRFEDSSAETLVEPDANEFCWTLAPEHFNP